MKKSISKKAVVLIIDVLCLLIALTIRPIASYMVHMPTACYFRKYYSLLCPSCGGTRGVYYLSRFELSSAFRSNQFFFLLAFYLIGVLVCANLAYVANIETFKTLFVRIASYKVIIALAVLWGIFGILRNVI